jgi:hypothetical protein
MQMPSTIITAEQTSRLTAAGTATGRTRRNGRVSGEQPGVAEYTTADSRDRNAEDAAELQDASESVTRCGLERSRDQRPRG